MLFPSANDHGGGRPSDSWHWEGDLLSGGKNSYIATLVEAAFTFSHADQSAEQRNEVVVTALSQHVRKLPATLRRSLTWDRGLEMANTRLYGGDGCAGLLL